MPYINLIRIAFVAVALMVGTAMAGTYCYHTGEHASKYSPVGSNTTFIGVRYQNNTGTYIPIGTTFYISFDAADVEAGDTADVGIYGAGTFTSNHIPVFNGTNTTEITTTGNIPLNAYFYLAIRTGSSPHSWVMWEDSTLDSTEYWVLTGNWEHLYPSGYAQFPCPSGDWIISAYDNTPILPTSWGQVKAAFR